ncbi:MAG TPA: pitrilysin family protein [Opitutaceae bacterium]|nr:pitrilysin family protein [Opitutaceae bacterium]
MRSYSADFSLLERFWHDPPERVVLANGLTILLKRDPSSPIASVQVWVKTGSIHEGAQLGAGLSHYLEHMLFKGTARRAGREISASVQALGGYINAYTTFDRTVYYLDLPAEHAAAAVDLLADVTLHSTLPADEVSRERDVILHEIDMGQDDPDHRLGEYLFAAAFREHPYRHPIIGYRDVFAAVTRDDLLAYYRARYVPNNLVVIAVGAFDTAAIRGVIEQQFGAVPRAPLAPVPLPDEPLQLAPRADHRFEDVQLTRAGLAWPIPGLTHADAPALDLLATILGYGDSSILWQAIRERSRLVHTIDAHAWNPGSGGLFCVSFTGDAGKREAAAAAIQRACARQAARGFSPPLMAKALRQAVVGEINTRKTMAGQAGRLGLAEVVVGDLDYSRTYFERLCALTAADLRRVLRTYLMPERLTAVSINPAGAVPATRARARGEGSSLADFEETALPNGARLLLQREPGLPNLHLRLLFLGGPLYETPGRRGATDLLATMLTKDTLQRSAAEVARLIEEVGGSFGPFSGNNSFGLALEVLPADLDRALELLADATLAPAFAPATFEKERAAQLAELQEDADDVVTFGRKRLRVLFFGDHPFAVDVHGDEASLKVLAPADLAALYRRLVVSGNAVLAVAGDFLPRRLTPKLKRFLARLPRGTLAPAAAGFAGPARVGDFVETQPRQQAVVFQAFPGPGLLAPDYYVSEVADELFSGMSSRLFERVRDEKGLAYFVRSARVVGLQTAMFCFFAGTSPDHQAEVLAEIGEEIARVQSGGVEATELQRCQTRLKAARRMSLQTNGARAMQAGLNALYGLPVNDAKQYEARIDAVTVADLQRLAQACFQPARRTQLVVRP